MEVKRDLYLNRLKDRMHNGMIKVVTGVPRCGKTYLLFNLFGDYLRGELGVPDNHIVEVALDTDERAALRDPSALGEHVRSRIADGRCAGRADPHHGKHRLQRAARPRVLG